MNFDSAFFLFCFFPITFVLYSLVPGQKFKNGVLLIAGLVFYSFGRLFDLALLLCMAAFNYVVGLLLRRERGRRVFLSVGVAANVVVLLLFKSLERLTVTITGSDPILYILFAQHPPVTLSIPLGISFFTFKCISYLVDVYRDRDSGTRNPIKFFTYISFFPQIISGPIARYRDFGPQLDEREISIDGAAAGLVI